MSKKTIEIVSGISELGINEKLPKLGGIFFYDPNQGLESEEVVVIMGGFAQAATDQKLLVAIAKKTKKPALIFDWHGLGISEGDFGDVTVERLFIDLKRVIGWLVSKGFFHFHFVGHSLAACVIAMTAKNPLMKDSKRVFIAPALNQKFLLRYWFAREKGYDFSFGKWSIFNSVVFRKHMRRLGKENEVDQYWPHEEEFLKYAEAKKSVKGLIIKADYWQAESSSDYSHCLQFTPILERITCRQTCCIQGENDEVVPLALIENSFLNFIKIKGADHYLSNAEEKAAEIAAGFIG